MPSPGKTLSLRALHEANLKRIFQNNMQDWIVKVVASAGTLNAATLTTMFTTDVVLQSIADLPPREKVMVLGLVRDWDLVARMTSTVDEVLAFSRARGWDQETTDRALRDAIALREKGQRPSGWGETAYESDIDRMARNIATATDSMATKYKALAHGKSVRWISKRDDKVRQTHDWADGQTIPADSYFVVGGYLVEFPGDPSAPPQERINCRCVLIIVDPITGRPVSDAELDRETQAALDQMQEESVNEELTAAGQAFGSPGQARIKKGNPQGGQWTETPGAILDDLQTIGGREVAEGYTDAVNEALSSVVPGMTTKAKISASERKTVLTLDLMDENGSISDPATGLLYGSIRRVFHPEQKIVDNWQFTLHRNLQGKGIGSAVTEATDQKLRDMGYDTIRITANIDVGGFTWARQGFEYTDRGTANQHAYDVWSRMTPGPAKDAAGALVESSRGNPNDPAPFLPADLVGIGWEEGLGSWPGKEASLGTEWNGVKHLNPVEESLTAAAPNQARILKGNPDGGQWTDTPHSIMLHNIAVEGPEAVLAYLQEHPEDRDALMAEARAEGQRQREAEENVRARMEPEEDPPGDYDPDQEHLDYMEDLLGNDDFREPDDRPYEEKELWEQTADDNTKMMVDAIEEPLKKFGLTPEIAVSEGQNGRESTTTIKLKDANGRYVGTISRSFDTVGNSVGNDYFVLKPEWQGKGIGSALTPAMEDMWRREGFSRVEVHANIDVGGYTWARQGFEFNSGADAGRTLARVGEYIPGWDTVYSPDRENPWSAQDEKRDHDTWNQMNDLLTRLEAGEEILPAEIAMIGYDPEWPGSWPGKEGMLGSDWYGHKDLHQEEGPAYSARTLTAAAPNQARVRKGNRDGGQWLDTPSAVLADLGWVGERDDIFADRDTYFVPDGDFGDFDQDADDPRDIAEILPNPKNTEDFTDDERNMLNRYTGSYAEELNQNLRYGIAGDAQVRHIDSAMEKSRLAEDATLYRRIKPEFLPDTLADYEGSVKDLDSLVGKVIKDRGYLSTSTDADNYAEGEGWPQFVISAPAGTKAINMKPISNLPWENEVLLDRKTPLAIERVFVDDETGEITLYVTVAEPMTDEPDVEFSLIAAAPNQARAPKGTSDGGQWIDTPSAILDDLGWKGERPRDFQESFTTPPFNATTTDPMEQETRLNLDYDGGSGATPREEAAVQWYTHKGDWYINHLARDGEDWDGFIDAEGTDWLGEADRATEAMDGLIGRTFTPHDLITYRGVGKNLPSDPAELDALIGKVISDPGYLSTSLYPEIAQDFVTRGNPIRPDEALPPILRIKVPKGTGHIWADPISLNQGEAELILGQDTPLAIEGWHRNEQGFPVIDVIVADPVIPEIPPHLTAAAPNQARAPKGTSRGGQWIDTPAGILADIQSGKTAMPGIREKVREQGGASISPITGQEPTDGYQVGREGYTKIIPADEFFGGGGEDALYSWIEANIGPLTEEGAHIGIWNDTESGNVVLDVSMNVKDRDEAIRLGQEWDQVAIWDVVNGEEIDTGGTGEGLRPADELSASGRLPGAWREHSAPITRPSTSDSPTSVARPALTPALTAASPPINGPGIALDPRLLATLDMLDAAPGDSISPHTALGASGTTTSTTTVAPSRSARTDTTAPPRTSTPPPVDASTADPASASDRGDHDDRRTATALRRTPRGVRGLGRGGQESLRARTDRHSLAARIDRLTAAGSPAQARAPKGTKIGGQWIDTPGGLLDSLGGEYGTGHGPNADIMAERLGAPGDPVTLKAMQKDPMGYRDRINPSHKDDPANCQRVVFATELQARGFDASAPWASGNESDVYMSDITERLDLSGTWSEGYGEYRQWTLPERNMTQAQAGGSIPSDPVGSRYFIQVKNKRTGGGHIMNAEKDANGKLIIYDGQSGNTKFRTSEYTDLQIIRVDDLPLEEFIFDSVDGNPPWVIPAEEAAS